MYLNISMLRKTQVTKMSPAMFLNKSGEKSVEEIFIIPDFNPCCFWGRNCWEGCSNSRLIAEQTSLNHFPPVFQNQIRWSLSHKFAESKGSQKILFFCKLNLVLDCSMLPTICCSPLQNVESLQNMNLYLYLIFHRQ